MTRRGWHVVVEPDAVTVARRLPARFDIVAETQLTVSGVVSLRRMAHQIRQDIWRALRDLRGFAPVVTAAQRPGHLHIRAGGELVAGRQPAGVESVITAVLADAGNRRRWISHAERRADA
ncbi:hypothetical protein ACRARG_14925 [Pseudooceanicola sp. C21-150M6]